MDLKDFTDLGNDIGRRVNDAIRTMNFDQLNQDIRGKVNDAFYGPNENDPLNGKLYHGPEAADYTGYTAEPEFDLYREGRREQRGLPAVQKPPGKVSSILFMIIGYLLIGAIGVPMIVMAVLGMTVGTVGTVAGGVFGAVAGGLLLPFLAGVVLAVIGTKKYGLISRFKRYQDILGQSGFCEIKDLAKKTGKTPKFVCKNIQKMIQKGFFREGHLDDQKTCFIGTNALYQQYIQARDSAAQSAKEREQKEKMQDTPSGSELEAVIAEGNSYIKTIREANDAIYNVEISEKLSRMEDIIKKIFAYAAENPEQIGQLRRFMSYYMPTTEKLVCAYRQLDEQTIQGDNIKKAKSEIAQTMDTINEAYEKLYDSMYVDVAMDVSSDISVLKTLFAQEGLAGDEMNGGKKK